MHEGLDYRVVLQPALGMEVKPKHLRLQYREGNGVDVTLRVEGRQIVV